MSRWITKELEDEIREKVDKITFGQVELSEEEIEEIKPKWLKHHEEHKNDNDVFEDNGIAIIWFEIPEMPKEKPKIYTNKDGTKRTNFLCKWKLGFISVWGSLGFWKPIIKETGKIVVVRGKITVQYSIRGTYGTGTYKDSKGVEHNKLGKKERYFDSVKKACEATGINFDTIDEDDIFKTYTLNAWQQIG